MDELSSYWQRHELKIHLIQARIDLAIGRVGFKPRCAVCGKLLMSGMDMHEAIITRGDIMKQPSLTEYIMVEENCVLVCPGGGGGRCHRAAHTKEGQILAIRQILTFLPYHYIQTFLIGLDAKMKGNQATEALALVLSIWSEVKNGKENELPHV